MAYASVLARCPAATYRQIDLAGRTTDTDPQALVQMLYAELVAALRAAAWATVNGRLAAKSERVTRATAILFALDAGLDHSGGNGVAVTLSRLYAGARAAIVGASVGSDPRPFRAAADQFEELAAAWRIARAAVTG